MPEFAAKPAFWEDFEVGTEVSRIHYLVTPDDIKSGAEACEDSNPLYFDKEFAKQTEWGGIIAPFYMIDCAFRWKRFLDKAGLRHEPIVIYTGAEIESFLPIRPGERLTGVMTVAEKYVKKDRKWLKLRIDVFDADGQKVVSELWSSVWTDRMVVFPTREAYEY